MCDPATLTALTGLCSRPHEPFPERFVTPDRSSTPRKQRLPSVPAPVTSALLPVPVDPPVPVTSQQWTPGALASCAWPFHGASRRGRVRRSGCRCALPCVEEREPVVCPDGARLVDPRRRAPDPFPPPSRCAVLQQTTRGRRGRSQVSAGCVPGVCSTFRGAEFPLLATMWHPTSS